MVPSTTDNGPVGARASDRSRTCRRTDRLLTRRGDGKVTGADVLGAGCQERRGDPLPKRSINSSPVAQSMIQSPACASRGRHRRLRRASPPAARPSPRRTCAPPAGAALPLGGKDSLDALGTVPVLVGPTALREELLELAGLVGLHHHHAVARFEQRTGHRATELSRARTLHHRRPPISSPMPRIPSRRPPPIAPPATPATSSPPVGRAARDVEGRILVY